MYDPHVDGPEKPAFLNTPSLFFIGTKHSAFKDYKFPSGSVVIDPHRYIPEQEGVKVVRIGQPAAQ